MQTFMRKKDKQTNKQAKYLHEERGERSLGTSFCGEELSQPIREKRHEIRTIKIVVVVVLLLFSSGKRVRVANAPIQ